MRKETRLIKALTKTVLEIGEAPQQMIPAEKSVIENGPDQEADLKVGVAPSPNLLEKRISLRKTAEKKTDTIETRKRRNATEETEPGVARGQGQRIEVREVHQMAMTARTEAIRERVHGTIGGIESMKRNVR